MKTFFNSIIFIYSIYQILGTIKSNIKFQINTNDILIKIKGNKINFNYGICSNEVYYINGTKIEIDTFELQIDNNINFRFPRYFRSYIYKFYIEGCEYGRGISRLYFINID